MLVSAHFSLTIKNILMINKDHELAKILIQKNLITKDELPNEELDLSISSDEFIDFVHKYLSIASSYEIQKKDLNNILKFIKNKSELKDMQYLLMCDLRILSSQIEYKSFTCKDILCAINEILDSTPNLLSFNKAFEKINPKFINERLNQLGINEKLRDAIKIKNEACRNDPHDPRNYKVIHNYKNSSKSTTTLMITNDDSISSIPGLPFSSIFCNVINAILIKNKLHTTPPLSNQASFLENKVKHVLLVMNELDRSNSLVNLNDQDKKIFTGFFDSLSTLNLLELESINKVFKKFYDDKRNSSEDKFNQFIKDLTFLFKYDKDFKIVNTDPLPKSLILPSPILADSKPTTSPNLRDEIPHKQLCLFNRANANNRAIADANKRRPFPHLERYLALIEKNQRSP
jgi:hypothetical protein